MTNAAGNFEERRRATLIGSGAVFLWSSLALFTTMTGDVPPFQMVAIAFAVAFCLALIKWMVRGESIVAPFRQTPQTWAICVGGLFGYHALVFAALKTAPPVEANLVNYLWPLLIVLFSAFSPGERLRLRHVLGALTGFGGVCVLVLGDRTPDPDSRFLLGYAAAFCAAFVWAGYSVASSRLADVSTDAIAAFCLVAAILSFAAHLLFETTSVPDATGWVALIALGLGPAGGAFFLWDWGLKRGSVRALGGIAYMAPLMSTGLLIGFGPGQLTIAVAIAALLLVGGAVLAAGDMLRKS